MRPNLNLPRSLRRNKSISPVLLLPWKAILQRLPASLLSFMILFAAFGPMFTPISYGIYFIFLHILFVNTNLRSAWGVYVAYRESKKWSNTDWESKYCADVGVHSTSDTRHDCPFDSVVHVILLPNYKESVDTLIETLAVLSSHRPALSQYKVCLAMEESEVGCIEKAQNLLAQFGDCFYELTFTVHPSNRPGEIRGKSSNVAWAATQMALRGGSRHDHEIITVMDADTCFAEDYFTSVSYFYCTASAQDRRIMMFAPCIVFDRNAKNVPLLVRVTDIFCGVLSNLYPSSPIKIPCSAYSLSMDLAISVNFWDAGPEALGEDMHMYLKCLFSTNGSVIVKSIYSPASQCNVEGTGTGLKGYISGLLARSTQSKRHLWGSLDTGYAIRRAIYAVFAEPERTFSQKHDKKDDNDQTSGFTTLKVLYLAMCLGEAHITTSHILTFLLIIGWVLPTNGEPSFWWSTFSDENMHPFLEYCLELGGTLRIAVSVFTIVGMVYYEKYHQWVGVERWKRQDTSRLPRNRVDSATSLSPFDSSSPQSDSDSQVQKVQYLGKRSSLVSERPYPRFMFDWIGIICSGFLFYGIPCYIAQFSHLFTDSLEYQVAGKPTVRNIPLFMASSVLGEPVTQDGKRVGTVSFGGNGVAVNGNVVALRGSPSPPRSNGSLRPLESFEKAVKVSA